MAKVKLNALPLTLGGATVLANHYRWGLLLSIASLRSLR